MFFKIVNFIASTFIFRPIVLIFAFGSFGFKTISYSGRRSLILEDASILENTASLSFGDNIQL